MAYTQEDTLWEMDFKAEKHFPTLPLSSRISYHLQYERCTVNLAQKLSNFFCKELGSILGFAGQKVSVVSIQLCHIAKSIYRQYSSPQISTRDTFQDPPWMPETKDSTKP